MISTRAAAAERSNERDTHDEAAVREQVRKAFLSIRGMRIDDVYPASESDGQVCD